MAEGETAPPLGRARAGGWLRGAAARSVCAGSSQRPETIRPRRSRRTLVLLTARRRPARGRARSGGLRRRRGSVKRCAGCSRARNCSALGARPLAAFRSRDTTRAPDRVNALLRRAGSTCHEAVRWTRPCRSPWPRRTRRRLRVKLRSPPPHSNRLPRQRGVVWQPPWRGGAPFATQPLDCPESHLKP